jgi:hypothetical protein
VIIDFEVRRSSSGSATGIGNYHSSAALRRMRYQASLRPGHAVDDMRPRATSTGSTSATGRLGRLLSVLAKASRVVGTVNNAGIGGARRHRRSVAGWEDHR